jgi:hypothetical protein
MFKVGDEVVCIKTGGRLAHLLKLGQVYRIKAVRLHSRLRGQALHFGHTNKEKGRLWFASISPHSAVPCFRKVVRDKAEAADESFTNLLKGKTNA